MVEYILNMSMNKTMNDSSMNDSKDEKKTKLEHSITNGTAESSPRNSQSKFIRTK